MAPTKEESVTDRLIDRQIVRFEGWGTDETRMPHVGWHMTRITRLNSREEIQQHASTAALIYSDNIDMDMGREWCTCLSSAASMGEAMW